MLPMPPIRDWMVRHRLGPQGGMPVDGLPYMPMGMGAPRTTGGNGQAMPMGGMATGGNLPAMGAPWQTGGNQPPVQQWATGGNQQPEPAMQRATGGNQQPDTQRPQWARAGMRGGAFGRGPLMGMYGRAPWGWEP